VAHKIMMIFTTGDRARFVLKIKTNKIKAINKQPNKKASP
jgi:hypothetical protein